MKRIAKIVLAVSLATAASVGMAASSSPFPRSAEGFPADTAAATGTYADRHLGDVVRQDGSPFPPGAESFPTMSAGSTNTYEDRHENDVVRQASSPYPESADEQAD